MTKTGIREKVSDFKNYLLQYKKLTKIR